MQFMNQMGGINLVVYYVTSVLQENVGLTRNLSLLLGGVIQIMSVTSRHHFSWEYLVLTL